MIETGIATAAISVEVIEPRKKNTTIAAHRPPSHRCSCTVSTAARMKVEASRVKITSTPGGSVLLSVS